MAKWEELPIADRAAYMKVAVQNGYRDIRSIREAYNKFEDGGEKQGVKKVGPTYNPITKEWTGPKGHNITGQSFEGEYGTTTYLDSGAVELVNNMGEHKYRYASNAPRLFIGGKTNEARQKYFDMDKEFTDSVKKMASQYGISANTLASRIAKEGPIDEAINHYNNTNGYIQRGYMIGPIWGLDDLGTMIYEGTIKANPKMNLFTDVEMENEKGRITYSVESDNYLDGVEITAAALSYFKAEMKKKFPNASNERLEQLATAAFNLGVKGATDLAKEGKIVNAYKPFIKIKKDGGLLTL